MHVVSGDHRLKPCPLGLRADVGRMSAHRPVLGSGFRMYYTPQYNSTAGVLGLGVGVKAVTAWQDPRACSGHSSALTRAARPRHTRNAAARRTSLSSHRAFMTQPRQQLAQNTR
jgi:hypothetical protein